MALTGDLYTIGTSNHTHAITSHDHYIPEVNIIPQFNNVPYWYVQPPAEVPQQKRGNMRGLFEVFIVDPEAGAVHSTAVVVADDAVAAKVKAIRKNYANDVDIDDLDIIVRRVGDVSPKKKAE